MVSPFLNQPTPHNDEKMMWDTLLCSFREARDPSNSTLNHSLIFPQKGGDLAGRALSRKSLSETQLFCYYIPWPLQLMDILQMFLIYLGKNGIAVLV